MNNKLGFGSICLLGIGTILGSGIFLLPGSFYVALSHGGILPILFIMITAFTISLCFAEASGIFEEYGGPYIYTRETMGDFMGFQVGFMKWIVSILAWSTLAIAFSNLFIRFFELEQVPYLEKGIAALLIIALSSINYFGVELAKGLNNIVTIGKLVPLLLFVFLGFKYCNYSSPYEKGIRIGELFYGFKDPLLIFFYAFTGFESIAVASRDMKNPLKNLPRAIVLVMSLISIIYLIIITSVVGILGSNLSNTSYPIFHAAYLLLGPLGGSFFSSGIIISVIGINIASSFITPRSIVALSEKRMVPSSLSKINKYRTPGQAIILSGVISLLLMLLGNFYTLASFSVISRLFQYVPTCVAVIILKKRGIKGTFSLPFGPLIPMLALLMILFLFYNYLLYTLVIFLLLLVIGRLFYREDEK